MNPYECHNIAKQRDEIEALSSIYGTDFHTEDFEKNFFSIDINEGPRATLEVTFPPDYPDLSPPTYYLKAPWLKGAKRLELCNCLEDIYLDNIGESIVYLWIEQIRQFIIEQSSVCNESLPQDALSKDMENMNVEEISTKVDLDDDATTVETTNCPPIFSGDIISDRKSHFQPHLAPVHSTQEVKAALKKLSENKKIANATHNMYAYRLRPEDSPVSCQNCDDDGENGAGARMMHLLQILEADNVLVVVSRWYGGIKLGATRFKHINNAARQILDSCGYITNKETGKKSKKKRDKTLKLVND